MKEKDYDAIAREIHTRHHIFVNDTFDRKEISEIVAILRKHDEAETSGEPGDGYWWCPECREAVDGHEVTFQEYHERCGTKVIAKTARPAPTDEKALREALFGIVNGYHDNGKYHWMLRADQVEQIMAEIDALLAHEAPKDESPKWVEHVICEGSREHVLRWDSMGEHCSEPNCIINKPKDESKEGGA